MINYLFWNWNFIHPKTYVFVFSRFPSGISFNVSFLHVCPLVAALRSACACLCSPCCCRACGCRWRWTAMNPWGGHLNNTVTWTRCCGTKFQQRITVKRELLYTSCGGSNLGLIVMGSGFKTEYHRVFKTFPARRRRKETGLFVERVFTGADRCFRRHVFAMNPVAKHSTTWWNGKHNENMKNKN